MRKGGPIVLAFVFAGAACGGRAESIVDAGDDGAVTGSGEAGFDGATASAVDAGSSDGEVAVPPSCVPGGPGRTNCGPGGSGTESCCTSLEVTGGTYFRTYDPRVSLDDGTGAYYVTLAADGGPAGLADPATVSSFRLDKYLVTVGRFRQFVNAVFPPDGGAGWLPPPGSGKHTHLNGGSGLNSTAGGYEPGWVATDDGNVAPTDTNLAGQGGPTWTNAAGTQETLPITCVNWYEAYAFCIWDGGFLPSEAEWEYAAAGGSQQREYPWGSTDPGTSNEYAIYDNDYTGNPTNIAPVGTATLGAGLWGQLDLAGELFEWNLDWYAPYYDPCTDCAETTADPPWHPSYVGMFLVPSEAPPASGERVFRGGYSGSSYAYELLSAQRTALDSPTVHQSGVGFRCARTP